MKNIKWYLHHGKLQNSIRPHHHTPTWQREGRQLIIATKGGIADKFAPVWVWRSKGCRPATCRETPTTQEALLLHHGDSGSSLGVWEERWGGIGGMLRELKGRRSEICPRQRVSRKNRLKHAQTNRVPQTARSSLLLPSTLPSADCCLPPSHTLTLCCGCARVWKQQQPVSAY